MPRRSASQLAVVPIAERRPRLAPSTGAPAEIVEIFAEILASSPAEHFKKSDAPLIEEYAGAIAMARKAAAVLADEGPVVAGRASPWLTPWLTVQEKSVRAVAALSARLRLSPQHRADSRSAGRKANDPSRSSYSIMEDVD